MSERLLIAVGNSIAAIPHAANPSHPRARHMMLVAQSASVLRDHTHDRHRRQFETDCRLPPRPM
jgi:hypothetical protein